MPAASFTAELHSVCPMHRATHSRRGRAETNGPQFKILNFKIFEILKSTKITEIFEAVLLLFRTISRLWLFGILSQEFTISKNEQSRKTSLKHFQSKRSRVIWADSGSKLIRYALLGSYGPDVVNFKTSVQCEEPMAPCSDTKANRRKTAPKIKWWISKSWFFDNENF